MGKTCKLIAMLGYIGYLPAPGTMGSIIALPFVYRLSFLNFHTQLILLIVLYYLSYQIISVALKSFVTSDPSEIILDECMGMFVTLFCIPYSLTTFCIGFLLFRIFDIFKPFGIVYIEKLPGAWGVLLDDFAAGLCAHLLLRIFFI
jgi:phosphatidylglycerophosphatase A